MLFIPRWEGQARFYKAADPRSSLWALFLQAIEAVEGQRIEQAIFILTALVEQTTPRNDVLDQAIRSWALDLTRLLMASLEEMGLPIPRESSRS